MDDIFKQDTVDIQNKWNEEFLRGLVKMHLWTHDYYAKVEHSKVIEIYSINENNSLIREPIQTLMLFPMTIVRAEGFELYGVYYSREDILKDADEIVKLDNS